MADKFSPNLLKFLKQTFDGFDTDGDGKLTKDDLRKMMRFSGENPTEEQVESQFAEFDADANDMIDFPEYVAVVAKRVANKGFSNPVTKTFKSLDKDGDGFLSRKDLSQTFEKGKIDEMMKYDEDQDDKLSVAEFAKWVEGNQVLGELFHVALSKNETVEL